MYVGKKVTRVDAHDKAMGRTRYTDDLCDKRYIYTETQCSVFLFRK